MKTKEQVRKNEKELKLIWLKFHEELTLREIFDTEMKDYFETAGGTDFKSVEWLTLVSLSAKWTREIVKEKKAERKKELEGQSIDQVQDGNRDRMILLLRSTLNKYEDDPKQLRNISLSDIKSLYKIIQSLEEVKKKTDLERGKLKLDALKTILPYSRLKTEQLDQVKDGILESFARIKNFEEGKIVTPEIEKPNAEELED